jgi:hypothetical protein
MCDDCGIYSDTDCLLVREESLMTAPRPAHVRQAELESRIGMQLEMIGVNLTALVQRIGGLQRQIENLETRIQELHAEKDATLAMTVASPLVWMCPSCFQYVPAGKEMCWACGDPRMASSVIALPPTKESSGTPDR